MSVARKSPPPHWLEAADAWAPLALVVVCTIWAAVQIFAIATLEEPAQGYEVERVARVYSQGEGFGLPNNHRWLFDAEPGIDPTAWVDPVYTLGLAQLFTYFGERAPGVALSLNVAAAVACFMILFLLMQRFAGAAVAVATVAVLAAHPWFRVVTLGLNNSTLAALAITLTALLFLRASEKPLALRAALLGVCLGVTALTHSSVLLFIPVVAILLLTNGPGSRSQRIRNATIVTLLACATIAPWTLRNKLVFDEFVPVRTGAGQVAHVGLVMLGTTIDPATAQLPEPPAWRASTPREAVRKAAGTDGRNALESAQRRVFALAPPPGYDDMNEAQRDKVHLLAARDYALDNPLLTAVMGVFKLELFARRLGSMGAWIFLAAYLSFMFLHRDRRVLALGALVAAYALPFAIFIAYFHRYRVPIEPLVVALAGIGAARLLALSIDSLPQMLRNRQFSALAKRAGPFAGVGRPGISSEQAGRS